MFGTSAKFFLILPWAFHKGENLRGVRSPLRAVEGLPSDEAGSTGLPKPRAEGYIRAGEDKATQFLTNRAGSPLQRRSILTPDDSVLLLFGNIRWHGPTFGGSDVQRQRDSVVQVLHGITLLLRFAGFV